MNAIETSGLTHRFGAAVAVDDVTFSVRRGEVFGFLGHNGAGKTTTVRLLNGVLTPAGGSMTVLGLSPERDGPALRARTGVLTETPSLDERLTARENLTIYADLYGMSPDTIQAHVEEMLAGFDLAERADEKVGGYSKGMKQRLALGRAFLHRPELLFLDEPTSGLDPVSSRQVHELIAHISREEGRTVFLCTHNLTEAQRLCDRVAVMEHGRMVAIGTPAELAAQVGGGMRFEVEVAGDQLQSAQQIMETAPGVLRVEVDGALLVASVSEREVIADALALLVGDGVRVYRVFPQELGLEDIYFALHERSHTQHMEKEAGR
jgi:ABC-2 type transport system ATP-binding protein